MSGSAWVALVAALSVAPACAGARPSSLERTAAAAVRERGIPGASVAVLHRGRVELHEGWGADRDAPYQIGSISKQFTAAAIMRLVEQGRIDLDSPFSRYLDGYPAHAGRVTVRQLLTHTSGIPEFFAIPGFDALELAPADRVSRADLVALFAPRPLVFEPGARWSYSNSNYTLLGLLVERASGRSYDTFLLEEFFARLGLDSTFACTPESAVERPGYRGRGADLEPAPPMNVNTAVGDGGLCSTAGDLVRWARALATGGVVEPESFRMMTAASPVRDHAPAPHGFGLSLVPLGAVARVSHGGRTLGYSSTLAYYPDHDLAIAVLTNRGGVDPEPIEHLIARQVLGLPAPVFDAVPLEPGEAARCAGTCDIGVFRVEVAVDGDALALRMPPPGFTGRLVRLETGWFASEDDPEAIAVRFDGPAERPDALVLLMGGMHWFGKRD